jgi:hypothetical protein
LLDLPNGAASAGTPTVPALPRNFDPVIPVANAYEQRFPMTLDLSPLDGRQLPQSGRVITRLRDVCIIDLPTADQPRRTCTRTAVIFADDVQADPRVYDILLSYHYRALTHRVNLIGLAKVRNPTRPALRWWYANRLDAEAARRTLAEATHAALRHSNDKWSVELPILVTMRPDGTVDRERLPVTDLLRLAVPGRYRLGLVQP